MGWLERESEERMEMGKWKDGEKWEWVLSYVYAWTLSELGYKLAANVLTSGILKFISDVDRPAFLIRNLVLVGTRRSEFITAYI